MATVWVLACPDSQFDPATQTCASTVFVPQTSALPELTIEDAQAIGVSIAYLFAVAYVFRLIRKHLNQLS